MLELSGNGKLFAIDIKKFMFKPVTFIFTTVIIVEHQKF